MSDFWKKVFSIVVALIIFMIIIYVIGSLVSLEIRAREKMMPQEVYYSYRNRYPLLSALFKEKMVPQEVYNSYKQRFPELSNIDGREGFAGVYGPSGSSECLQKGENGSIFNKCAYM